jgi:hypothetical protein
MKVKELIKELKKVNPNLDVMINVEFKDKFYTLNLTNLEEQEPFKEVWLNCEIKALYLGQK